MQIRYKNNGAVKHVANEVGQGFIDAGLADEVRPCITAPIPTPKTTWEVLPGEREGQSPFVHAFCSGCSHHLISPSPSPTTRFQHCRTLETVPAEIGKKHAGMLADFRQGTDRPSSVSPAQSAIERKRFERLTSARKA